MRRVVLLLSLGLLSAAPAHAAGGPVPPAFGGAGVSAPTGSVNFVALAAGPHRTVVTRVRTSDGLVERSRVIGGVYGVPGVTYDGIDTGLSADGGTLVLAAPPQKRSSFRVLDAETLRTRQTITLPGMVTVDAISPDGRWLYLVDYHDGNAARYDVRAYDLRRHRLLARPIVDPREPEEKLQGFPMTRVQSGDGRWAYTLYSGEHPFIHALDTAGRTAVCIDLPQAVSEFGEVAMTLEGPYLRIADAGRAYAFVDLRTYKVSRARAATPAKPAPTATPRPAAATDAGPPWALWLLPLGGLAAVAIVARRRRVRQAHGEPAGGEI